MEQTIPPSSLQAEQKPWRAGLRVLFGFLFLYAVIWVIRVVMGVGPNLIGAQTRLQSPLTATGFSFGNVVVLDMAILALIALGIWLYFKLIRQHRFDLST